MSERKKVGRPVGEGRLRFLEVGGFLAGVEILGPPKFPSENLRGASYATYPVGFECASDGGDRHTGEMSYPNLRTRDLKEIAPKCTRCLRKESVAKAGRARLEKAKKILEAENVARREWRAPANVSRVNWREYR